MPLFAPTSHIHIYQTKKNPDSLGIHGSIQTRENNETTMVQVIITPNKEVLASLTWNELVLNSSTPNSGVPQL